MRAIVGWRLAEQRVPQHQTDPDQHRETDEDHDQLRPAEAQAEELDGAGHVDVEEPHLGAPEPLHQGADHRQFDDPHRCFEPECHQGFGGDLDRLTPRQNLGGTASRGSREPTNNQAFTAARNGSDNPAGSSTSTDELACPFVLTDTLLAFFANISCL